MWPINVKFLARAFLSVFVAAVVVVESAVPIENPVVNMTLADQYKKCLGIQTDPPSGATQSYLNCLKVPSNSSVKNDCDIQDVSHCVTFLADIPNFQECIGPENLETLRESGNIFHSQYKYFCNDGAAVLKQYLLNDGVNCERKHKPETDQCEEKSNIPVVAFANELKKLSGFTYDVGYCSALKTYHKCFTDALTDCHPSVVDYNNLINDLRWKALPCSGSHIFPAPTILAAAALVVMMLTNLMKY